MAIIDGALTPVVSGDPGRLRQVLTNLIGNAIKFTQSGEIVVRVLDPEMNGADARIRFEVSDTGDGIAPDKLALVLQPFVQGHLSTPRKYGGTGLGLAISAQLVALMGGECGVISRLARGRTFWFTIRVRVDAASVAPEHPPLDADMAGVRVLIVDDSAAQRGVLSSKLADTTRAFNRVCASRWGCGVTMRFRG
ncbi:MAG TPA: ATP-binding protein [Acidimicrobiales bacterium]|nr:ATP-binding protein [Acidimicrobiales bacterium]